VSILLEKGQRGFIVGAAGSGKTHAALHMLQATRQTPVFILDTKMDTDAEGRTTLDHLDREGERLTVVESPNELARLKPRKTPDYVVIRPPAHELADPELLDSYCQHIYDARRNAFVYIDEAYQLHKGLQPLPGFLGLLTRGRSRGLTTLMGAQRPSYLSRFCLTESNKFYVFRLLDARDRRTLGEVIPNFAKMDIAPKHYFYHYSAGEDAPQLYRPFPLIDLEYDRPRGWI
jgi:hypothetical protein